MAKDTKRSQGNRNNSSGGNGSPLLAGLLVGLAIGVVAAIGVAYYINRSANPFSSPAMPAAPASAKPSTPQAPEILRPGVGKEDAPVAPASVPEQKNASSTDRFDFYTMLPGLADKNGKEAKPASTNKPEAGTPEAQPRQWLQAGAFQNEKDADNLKAKLALIGIEARIQTQDIPGKGLWHRVRVGPYGNPSDLDRAKTQLHANGIESVAVKAD